jgi:hypothetical protein
MKNVHGRNKELKLYDRKKRLRYSYVVKGDYSYEEVFDKKGRQIFYITTEGFSLISVYNKSNKLIRRHTINGERWHKSEIQNIDFEYQNNPQLDVFAKDY